jgi:potassium-transporting ATPase potassium-binding subunit
LFATVTTAVSCGAVNSMHGSYTPIGGLIPMVNMQLGEVIFGGVGVGLYSVLLFVFLAVFLAGLIIGRTPEYLGKKIESFEIKLTMIALLSFILLVLGFSSFATLTDAGRLSISQGPHGFSEILYAYSSCCGNNGSSFSRIESDNLFYNITLGLAMLFGRFCFIIPVIAMAGSFASKKKYSITASSFPISGITFIWLLIGVIILIGALTFLPSLVMGPIMENFYMIEGNLI